MMSSNSAWRESHAGQPGIASVRGFSLVKATDKERAAIKTMPFAIHPADRRDNERIQPPDKIALGPGCVPGRGIEPLRSSSAEHDAPECSQKSPPQLS